MPEVTATDAEVEEFHEIIHGRGQIRLDKSV
jgi:hypothetical protein